MIYTKQQNWRFIGLVLRSLGLVNIITNNVISVLAVGYLMLGKKILKITSRNSIWKTQESWLPLLLHQR